MKRGSVLLIWDRMGDYHRARWKALQEAMTDATIYAADLGATDKLYGWATTQDNPFYVQLSAKSPTQFDASRIFKFAKLILKNRIKTVCIPGYGKPEYVIFLLLSLFMRRRVVLFAESWYPSHRWLDILKSLFLKCTCDAFLVSGTRAQQHFVKRLGIRQQKIRTGYSVVDNVHFSKSSDSTLQRNRILLCIARFVPEKQVDMLIRSFLASSLPRSGWTLKLVGGGPMGDALREMATGQPIIIKDWEPYSRLPYLYHESQVFILPSSFEPWGLVINEAMAASLPVLISSEVGCLPDLVKPGVNGYVFPSGDETALVSLLNKIDSLESPSIIRLGINSRDIISRYDLSVFADNLKALILKSD